MTKELCEIPSLDKLRETLAQYVDSGMSRLDAINRMAEELGVRPDRLYKTLVGSPPKEITWKNSEVKKWFEKLFNVKHWFGVSPEKVERILSTSPPAPSRDDLEQRIRNYTKWGWSPAEALAKVAGDAGISPEEVKRIITQSPAEYASNQGVGTVPIKSKVKSILKGVDFKLARDELAYIFHIGIEEAKKKGESLIAKKELVNAWEKFRVTPCLENAINLLEISPIFLDIFENCKPGGRYWFYKSPAVTKVAKTIIDATHYCAESFKEDLERNLSSEKEIHEKYIHIYLEFFFFLCTCIIELCLA